MNRPVNDMMARIREGAEIVVASRFVPGGYMRDCPWLKAASFKVKVAAGYRTVKLPKKKLAKGSYKAIITPVDAAGNRGKANTVTFKVR